MIVFTKLNNLQLKNISKYLKQLSIVSNMFALVPILQIVISINRVTALAISGLNTLTSITSVFSLPWSLLSPVSNEICGSDTTGQRWHQDEGLRFLDDHGGLHTARRELSRNIAIGEQLLGQFREIISHQKWKIVLDNELRNFTSAVNTLMNGLVFFYVTKKYFICSCVFVTFFKLPRLAHFEWRTTSYLTPNDMFTLHILQYANIAPLSLTHITST
jgi:hypothetical protein